jgi:hypothetical protein
MELTLMYDIKSIQSLFDGNAVKYTEHFKLRRKERNIKHRDIKHTLLSGEIIGQYPDDTPLPSILVFGHTNDGEPLHVVVGVDDDKIWIITAYYPTLDIWENDYKTKKADDAT